MQKPLIAPIYGKSAFDNLPVDPEADRLASVALDVGQDDAEKQEAANEAIRLELAKKGQQHLDKGLFARMGLIA